MRIKNLTQVILLAGSLLLALVTLLGAITATNIARLGQASQRLARDALVEQQLIDQFQTALNSVVIHADSYARTEQRGLLRDARDALAEARALLPALAEVTHRTDPDGFADDRQQQRAALVSDAEKHLARLEVAQIRADSERVLLSLQRLDLVAQDTATLARISRNLSAQRTEATIADVNQQLQQGLFGTIGIFTLLAITVLAAVLAMRSLLVHPLRRLGDIVRMIGTGHFDQRAQVNSHHEVGQLQAGINAMAENLLHQQTALTERATALQAANEQQARLLETINALGAPVLPVLDGVLVLPVVGHVDGARAQQLTSTLLDIVYRQQTQVVILDVTGLATHDAAVVPLLVDIMRATELLGAHVTLAGINPIFAIQIAERANDLTRLKTYRTLQDAIHAVL